MRRREFVVLIEGSAVAWPLAAIAQQTIQMRRIGVLMAYEESIAEAQAWVAAFREGFQKFGWTEGGNFQIRHAGCLNAKNDFGHTHRIVVKNLAPASRVQ
jgi:putative ABC transport system substrate-binding protein